jgi:hypothetical protein
MRSAEEHFVWGKRDDLWKVRVWMGNSAYAHARREKRKKTERTDRANISHETMREVHAHFEKYISDMQGATNPNAFLPWMYRAELTGAEVQPLGAGEHPPGIVLEERENSLILSYPDRVRTFPKKSYDFLVSANNRKYVFLGSRMHLFRSTSR